MIKGFKEFISQGNALDLAVAVIIGGAFTPIVTAITTVIMAILAGVIGQPNFDDVLSFSVNGSVVQPGTIITAVVNFLIVAAALYFCVVMPMNRLAERRKSGQADPEEAPSDEVLLLTEIRDALTNDGQGRLRQ